MSITNGLAGAIYATLGRGAVSLTVPLSPASSTVNHKARYALMSALASTNPYASIADILSDYDVTAPIQGLRTPVNAVAQFYRANVWPGTIREGDDESALPVLTRESLATAENLTARLHDVWGWSNWNGRKDTFSYDLAALGDQLLTVRSDAARRRAWFEVVQPWYITDIDTDGRGYLTYIRTDIPDERRTAAGVRETVIITEVWHKAAMTYRRWEHALAGTPSLDMLGTPVESLDMEQVFGVDFVPFVMSKFEDDSTSVRGTPAVWHALDKIIYGDALASALYRRLGRENDWVLEGTGTDEDGMPVAAPALNSAGGFTITMGGGQVHGLPSGWRLRDLVSNMSFAEHLATIEAHYADLRKTDLPELSWYEISEAGNDQSGAALTVKLTPATARIRQARGNAEDALARITQMCLSVAQKLGAPGFGEAEIGTYQAGAFEHWYADRALVPMNEAERSELATAEVARVKTRTDAGSAYMMALIAEGATPEEAQRLSRQDVVDGIQQ